MPDNTTRGTARKESGAAATARGSGALGRGLIRLVCYGWRGARSSQMPGERWTAGRHRPPLFFQQHRWAGNPVLLLLPAGRALRMLGTPHPSLPGPVPAPLPACRKPRTAGPPPGGRPLLRTPPRPGGGRPPPVTLGRAGLAGGGPSGLRLCRGVGKRLREGLLCWRCGVVLCRAVPCLEPPRIYLSLPPRRAHDEATLRGNYLRQRYGRDYRRG